MTENHKLGKNGKWEYKKERNREHYTYPFEQHFKHSQSEQTKGIQKATKIIQTCNELFKNKNTKYSLKET